MSTYDFSKVSLAIVLTPDWILSKVSDSQIFFHYHGRFKLAVACKSSLRKDNNPSVTFFVGESGRIIYWDFRDGRGMDCFAYVQALYNCSFRRALETIAEDFGLINKQTIKVSPKLMLAANELDRTVKKETLIQFTTKPWQKGIGKNLSFWNLYEIEQDELEREKIFPVDRLFLNKQEILNPTGQLRFAKIEKYEDRTGVKIYSPFDLKMKWLSSIPLNVPFGLNTLNCESNLILITKSFKDMIVLKKLFPSVIATQNESEAALPDNIVTMLDGLFDHKVIVFDNDETGVNSCKKFNDRGFGYFNIPNEYRTRFGIKDPSDYVKTYGLEELKKLFQEKNLL